MRLPRRTPAQLDPHPTPPFPPPEQANAVEVFMLSWSLIAGIPLIAGNTGSAVMEAALNEHTVIAWGLCLFSGSLMALGAMAWTTYIKSHTDFVYVVKRTGLGMVGISALIYAWVVWHSVPDHDGVTYIVSLQVGFGTACLWRFWQITKRIRWTRAQRKEV